ncbi:MAG: 30S ribosomal protein S4 [Gemmataceae bacterium]|nr:30S ribosomal protein S4 [Gemmataceae bacterium]
MGRNLDPACRQCRREGIKLYLKGKRCDSPKCPIDRDHPPPGMHGTRRSKASEYGIRLREKQRLKRFYGLLDRQFSRFFKLAARSPENTGEQLLSLLERRLDNVVHRLGFAPSRRAARQLVSHGHVMVNGKACNIPSFLLRVGDTIRVKTRNESLTLVRNNLQDTPQQVPDYLEMIGTEPPEARMIRLPSRDDVDPRIKDIREQLIIELVSR